MYETAKQSATGQGSIRLPTSLPDGSQLVHYGKCKVLLLVQQNLSIYK